MQLQQPENIPLSNDAPMMQCKPFRRAEVTTAVK
jgi:hypothetical protein